MNENCHAVRKSTFLSFNSRDFSLLLLLDIITGGSGIVRIGSISSLQYFICVYEYLIIDGYVRVCMCVCVFVCECVCVYVCVYVCV